MFQALKRGPQVASTGPAGERVCLVEADVTDQRVAIELAALFTGLQFPPRVVLGYCWENAIPQ